MTLPVTEAFNWQAWQASTIAGGQLIIRTLAAQLSTAILA
jgi:hypothetical protein